MVDMYVYVLRFIYVCIYVYVNNSINNESFKRDTNWDMFPQAQFLNGLIPKSRRDMDCVLGFLAVMDNELIRLCQPQIFIRSLLWGGCTIYILSNKGVCRKWQHDLWRKLQIVHSCQKSRSNFWICVLGPEAKLNAFLGLWVVWELPTVSIDSTASAAFFIHFCQQRLMT